MLHVAPLAPDLLDEPLCAQVSKLRKPFDMQNRPGRRFQVTVLFKRGYLSPIRGVGPTVLLHSLILHSVINLGLLHEATWSAHE